MDAHNAASHLLIRQTSIIGRPASQRPGELPSRHVDAYAGMGVCMALTTILLVLRLRARITKLSSIVKLAADDYTALLGWLCITAHNIVVFTNLHPNGALGVNIWDVSFTQTNNAFIQRNLAAICLYVFAALAVKLSLLTLYLRLFGPNKQTRYVIYGGITTCVIFYLITLVISLVIFIPPPDRRSTAYGWVFNLVRYDTQQFHTALARAVFGVISDIYLLAIPIWCVMGLQLKPRQRWGLVAVFGTGIIAISCSVGAVVVRVRLSTNPNTSWYSLDSYILSTAEISAGLICCCLPVIAGLLKAYTKCVLSYSGLSSWWSLSSRGGSKATRSTVSTTVEPKEMPIPLEPTMGVAGLTRPTRAPAPYAQPARPGAEDNRKELARMRRDRLRVAERNGEVSSATAMAMALSLAAELDEWDSGSDEFFDPDRDEIDDRVDEMVDDPVELEAIGVYDEELPASPPHEVERIPFDIERLPREDEKTSPVELAA